jgi:hypothetical protein
MDSLSPEQIEILASEDQAPKIIGIVSALTVLALVSVVLRFFTRIKFTRQLGAEDYTIACSVVCPKQYYDSEVRLTLIPGFFDLARIYTNQTSTIWGRKTYALRG